ncbi:MAG: Mut7-C RNAse domain-containing protein [Candidatus Nitrosocosmicus sp.]
MACPKFLVDSMLGKIAKKLRIFGFDTEYYPSIDDNTIIKKSHDENKIVLTMDKMLYKRCIKHKVPCKLLSSNNEFDNLICIMKENNIDNIFYATNNFTRCTVCNGKLLKTSKSKIISITNTIPQKIVETIDTFYCCSDCKKVYWNGTHIQEINKLIMEINKKLNR